MTYQFKTNINCGSCVNMVSGTLNEEIRIQEWEVDTSVADKILTLKSDGMDSPEIIALVSDLGFEIELLQS